MKLNMSDSNILWEHFQYAPLVDKILTSGEARDTRAGRTLSIFGETITVDTQRSFPILNGRKMFYKPVLGELAAMLRGPKHVEDFKKFGCNYWDEFAFKLGDCLPDGDLATGGELELDYGNSWLDFNGVNQLEQLVDKLKNNPTDRRLLISGWRPDRLAELSLPCCHMLYQWYVRDGRYLDMLWYQRSVDVMVGLPSDVILAAAWNIILANQCGYTPGIVKLVLGDTHIYANHMSKADDYLKAGASYKGPWNALYAIAAEATVANFIPDMLPLAYESQPAIKFTLNV